MDYGQPTYLKIFVINKLWSTTHPSPCQNIGGILEKKKILKEFFVVKKNEASFGLIKKILCVKIGILKIEPYLNLKI